MSQFPSSPRPGNGDSPDSCEPVARLKPQVPPGNRAMSSVTDHRDGPRDECGVFGIYAPEHDVARLAYFALYALQHRGQESAGIAVSDGGSIECHREMGLLSSIFDEDILSRLTGYIATGHTRYSTTGSSIVVNAQPLLESTELGEFAISHNGNLTNTDAL